MIGRLLKELSIALRRYLVFRAKVTFSNPAPAESPIVTAPLDEPKPVRLGMRPAYQPRGSFDWQILSAPGGEVYAGGPSPDLLDLLVSEPKFILDVGCSLGDFAASAKVRFPQARVWGIEPNQRAAQFASGRIDRVIRQPIESIDWTHEGVEAGDIDTVFLFDVLEHIFDPWTTLLALRNLISSKAQVLVSIPNVRNVLLIQDLISGYWRYRRAGLLDITHIRFFTEQDMYRMFYQTGFRVLSSGSTQCARSREILEQYRHRQFPSTIELDGATISVRSAEDLGSLCALQHIFLLQPADYHELSSSERQWIDGEHPATTAYCPEEIRLAGA